MDAQRFDNLAKSLAGRLTRRNAMRRAGAAASATVLASAGIRAAPALVSQTWRMSPSPILVLRASTLAMCALESSAFEPTYMVLP